MALNTMFPPAPTRPISQYSRGVNLGPVKTGFGPFSGTDVALLRDNFHIPTWILLGCIIQYLLTLAVRPSLAVLPAFLLISWGIIDTLLMRFNLKKNPWYAGVIDGKIAPGYPATGQRTALAKPAENGPGAVMILGTRSHSPMGMFIPGFKEIGDRFREMVAQLETDQTAGFMGMSSWISTERSASNEYATVSYWRSVEDIHAFALGPLHREAWNWWNDTVAKGGHRNLGIMHEIFEVPKTNGFEGIYINYHPTGLLATTRPVEGPREGELEWVVPIVDARTGVYRSSRGRMSRGDALGASNEKVARDPYAV